MPPTLLSSESTFKILKIASGASGVPGLQPAIEALEMIYNSAKEVSIHQGRAATLILQCDEVLVTIRDNSRNVDKTKLDAAIRKTVDTILSMRVDMSRWSYYSTWRCWCERHTIEGRLNEFSASLRQCLDLLGLAADLEGINQVAEVKEMVAEDKRHINTIENQVNEIHKIVTELQTTRTTATPGSPEHAEATTALLHISVSPEPYVLRPPDLKGDVQKIGDYPISFGSKYDTYKGLFLGEVFVAMKFLRGPGMTGEKTEDDIRRFDRQVDLWRTLKHKHVLDLTGYCILNGNEMCLVSPWMENRDVVWYLNKNPNANRFQLITDIALGLKYLHSINTLHGGLQPKNTLVSKEAYAVLGGFSLAKLLRDDEPTFFSQSDGPVSGFRYQPPEVIGGQPLTPSSDVYSWAMCALEIMTGHRPFHYIKPLGILINAIKDHQFEKSRYPSPMLEQYPGLWELFERCIKSEPEDRPTISEVLGSLEEIRSKGTV